MSQAIENKSPPLGNNLAAVPVALISSTSSLNPVLANESGCNHSDNPVTALSSRRWFVLFAASCFAFAMAITSDTAPILDLILELLDLPIDKFVYINQTFYYIMAIMAVPIAWMADKYGIRATIYAATALFMLNCSLRALLYSPNLPHWSQFKLHYYVASCIIGTQVSAVLFLMPLKVSETWFSESERSVAWTIMVSQLELGVCIASYLYPRLMQDLEHIQLLAYINIVSVFVIAIVCFTCVTRAAPEHPPSIRMANSSKDTTPFFSSVKKMFKSKDIVLHLFHLSVRESLFIATFSILQNILISAGHSKLFAGNFMSINALVAIIMLVFMARHVHKVKNTTLTCKLSSLGSSVLFVIYLFALIYKAPGWVIICVSIALVMIKSWASPNFTNMTAHLASGVVSQATIVGFSITLTVVVVTVVQLTFVSLANINKKTSDYSHSLMFLSIVCLINELIYLTFFQGKSINEPADDENRDAENQSVR